MRLRKSKFFQHKVIKSSVWYTFSNFFVRGVAFLSIPIFTRLLSTSDYGKISVFATYVAIFTVVASLGLTHSAQRGLLDFKSDFDNYISSIAFLSFLLFLVFFSIMSIIYRPMSKLLEIDGYLYFFLIGQAYFAFVRRFILVKFRLQYKYRIVSLANIAVSIASIGLSIILIKEVFTGEEYLGKIIGTGIFPITIGIASLLYLIVKGKKLINPTYWKAALFVSVPFIFHSISGIINAQFDRIIIAKYLSTSQTGLYSFAYNIGLIISVVWMSMNSAFNPYFFEKIKEKEDNEILIYSKLYRDAFTIIFLVLLLISPEIVKLMAEESYWVGLNIVPWIFFALFFQVLISFESKIIYVHKKTYLIPIGTIIAAASNIVLNIIFIPIYGYEAAAVTTVISYVFLFLYHFFVTKFVVKTSFYGFLFHFRAIFAAVVGTVIFIYLKDVLYARIASAIVVIVLGSFLLFRLYKSSLRNKQTL